MDLDHAGVADEDHDGQLGGDGGLAGMALAFHVHRPGPLVADKAHGLGARDAGLLEEVHEVVGVLEAFPALA
ncbi:hypothetical protein D3C86_2035780 [compost metagenome]